MSTEASKEGTFREGPPPPMKPGPKRKSRNAMRYAVSFVLLVAIVGGLAWVTQYLPGWRKQTQIQQTPIDDGKMLSFTRTIAQWGSKEDDEAGKSEPKEFEPGAKGHYDFLFQNISGHDVDVAFFVSSCDCAGVKAAVLPDKEWERLNQEHQAKPGLPLPYKSEPEWVNLPAKKPTDDRLRVEPGGKGVLRMEWTARASIGQLIPLRPRVAIHKAGDTGRGGSQELHVPGKVVAPIQYHPARVEFNPLTSERSTTSKFLVWSSTRDKLDFSLAPEPPDPLFAFKIEPIPQSDLAARAAGLQIARKDPAPDGDTTKQPPSIPMRCAYDVSVTVHESKNGKHLDQGTFYRRWAFTLDGQQNPDAPIFGPEFVGRVEGDVRVGGADNQGRILFKSFSAKLGERKEVQLAADAKLELEKFDGHPEQPWFLKVNLTRGNKDGSGERTLWHLEVIVPPGAASPGQFNESNAVVLRIKGTSRLVRIPLDGHISR